MNNKNKTWSNQKTIDFINEIFLHPSVWDVESSQYKDRYVKKDAWSLIANEFDISADEAYKKLRSLGTYAKNENKKKKSGSERGKQSTWFAYDAISFILFRDTPNKGVDTENTTEIDDMETLREEMGETITLSESHLTEEAVLTNSSSKKKKLFRTDTTYEKAVNIINEASTWKKSEFSVYGEHIANKLESYDMSTRAHVQLEFSKILYEADMKTINQLPSSCQTCEISDDEINIEN